MNSQAKFCLSHRPLSGKRGNYTNIAICTDRPRCLSHRPLRGEGGHYMELQATLASYKDHFVVKEATMSTLGRPVCFYTYQLVKEATMCTVRPLCLLHRPLRSDESHYVQIQATLASCGEGGHYEHCRQAILFFTHTN